MRRLSGLPAGIAAGHPATTEAGVEVLRAGGSAADAAVAACLASCVAETVMTGLLGGGHALVWDAERGLARNLDLFCTVPGLQCSRPVQPMERLEVPFGEELLHYAVGPASCAVPGVPAGLGTLHEAYGRLPWASLVDPAVRLARDGVVMPPAHADCLRMLAPVMTMEAGAQIYAPGGRLLSAGDVLRQPGLAYALEMLVQEGPSALYTGSLAEALLDLMRERGGAVTEADLASYRPTWSEPVALDHTGARVLTRGGLSGVPATFRAVGRLRGLSPAERVVRLAEAFAAHLHEAQPHTTNLVTVDADGNAVVLTTSLGLGSGDYVPGLDLHLNSMLGETDLIVGDLEPGDRVHSMIAPTLAVDDDGPLLAIGSAGGTRLRTALVSVAAGVLDEGLAPQEAADRPRLHPTGDTVNAEPGVDEGGLAELERRGWSVRRWSALHHYFGGVSLAARSGLAADPRRSGAAALLDRP